MTSTETVTVDDPHTLAGRITMLLRQYARVVVESETTSTQIAVTSAVQLFANDDGLYIHDGDDPIRIDEGETVTLTCSTPDD